MQEQGAARHGLSRRQQVARCHVVVLQGAVDMGVQVHGRGAVDDDIDLREVQGYQTA